MGFFKKLFKGIKNVVKGIGRGIKKIVKSKAFRVIATVALAIVAPQLLGHALNAIAPTLTASSSAVISGIGSAMQTAGTYLTGSGATAAIKEAAGKGFWANVKAVGTSTFQGVTEQISGAVNSLKGGGKTMVTKSNQTLEGLAKANNMTVAEITKLNPKIGFSAKSYAGKILTPKQNIVLAKDTFAGGKVGTIVKNMGKDYAKTTGENIIKEAESGKDTSGLEAVSRHRYSQLYADERIDTGSYSNSLMQSLSFNHANNPYASEILRRGHQLFGVPTMDIAGNVQ